MTAATDGSPPTRWRFGLLVVALIALALRLAFSRVNPVNYDGYWHVFIARNLSREFGALAHPPLFPILLRQADAIRHSRFSYLSISLLTGTASVLLLGLVLGKLCTLRATPLLGALALALSPSAITLSGVAEAYMLCAAFLLAAVLAYVDLLAPGPPGPATGRRVAFSAFASLALLSHYAAGLFLLAALAAPLALAVIEPRYRAALKWTLPSRLVADVVTLVVPVAVAAALFFFLARPWVHRLSHVAAFYFEPARETIPAFVVRALAGTFNLFAPLRIANPIGAAAALVAFVTVCVAIAVASDRRRDATVPGAMPSVLLVLILALEAAAGLGGWYPFGGAMRHQFLLLLFALMAAAVAFDRILLGVRPAGRRALVAVGVAAIAANAWGHLDRRWRPRPEPFSAERERFDRDFPDASEVHVDQFNLVGFFAQHHDWNWEFLGPVAGEPARQHYRLSSNGRSLELVAHRDIWNMDPLDPALYRALMEAPASPDSRTSTLYCVHQALPGQPARDPESLRRRIPVLAREAGLEVEGLDVVDGSVFAEFRRVEPPAPPR